MRWWIGERPREILRGSFHVYPSLPGFFRCPSMEEEMTRDPKQDPKRADMLKSAEGVLLTVLGRPEFDDIIGVDPCVRYSQSEVPYISTVNLPRWQNMVRDHEVEHVAT